MSKSLRQILRSFRQGARSARQALVAKGAFLRSGSSPVSDSCQIPELREKYSTLGLPLKGRGIFVEIGAFDGESWSNTSFLADQGWRGIYVEPVPDFCAQIAGRHFLNDVSIENAAIAATEGSAAIEVMGALSTFSDATKAAYDEIRWARSAAERSITLEVRTTTLQKVLQRHAVPVEFDLMVVDVEGHEEPVIADLMASRWRPRVLIVELIDLHPDFEVHPALQASARRVRQAILAGGYRQFYADPINSIFSRSG